jgi:Tfp pilus assembly protein PilF
MEAQTFAAGFFGISEAELIAGIARNLLVSVLAVPVAVLLTVIIYRVKIATKDNEIRIAHAAWRKELGNEKILKDELEKIQRKFAEFAPAVLDHILAAYDREERSGDPERAAGVLQGYFERERRKLARLSGALGDWYAGFISDDASGRYVKHARGFYALALFADPDNERWKRAAADMETAASFEGGEGDAPGDGADDAGEDQGLPSVNSAKDPAGAVAGLLKRGSALHESGNYYGAHLLAKRAYSIAGRRFGKEHALTLSALHLQAKCLSSLGDYGAALTDALAVLDVRERTLGRSNLNTAESYSLAGAIFMAQANNEKAEEFLQRALAIRQSLLGQGHADTAASLQDLATLYDAQGRYSKAEPLYQQALSITKKAQDPATATTLNVLAEHYRVQGRYLEAEPLYRRALAIRESILGADHPNTAESLNNLAGLYCGLDRFGEAEPLYRRALAIQEKALGANHPDTATCLSNLAGVYCSLARHAEAEPLIKRALAIKERVLGSTHPDTQMIKANLSRMLADTKPAGQTARALH